MQVGAPAAWAGFPPVPLARRSATCSHTCTDVRADCNKRPFVSAEESVNWRQGFAVSDAKAFEPGRRTCGSPSSFPPFEEGGAGPACRRREEVTAGAPPGVRAGVGGGVPPSRARAASRGVPRCPRNQQGCLESLQDAHLDARVVRRNTSVVSSAAVRSAARRPSLRPRRRLRRSPPS
jgi:hypothetical protein